jgi:glyoxylase-like metal-dependent hydrolase (beta-lactamase superfamily II)
VYVVAGAGGHIVVFAGDDGLFLVDSNFHVFYDQIMAGIRKISNAPIRFVVNTHSHLDHVQNNDRMAMQGAAVVAHPNTRRALMSGSAPAGLPTITPSAPLTFHFNGEQITVVPLKPAHTDGDLAVYFHGSDVWAFGDEFTGDYPGMSVQAGASTENFVDNYNLALTMTTPNTIFVPGHGQLWKRERLTALRDAITTVHDRVREMVAKGMTQEEIVKARPSREFDADFAPEKSSPTTFVTTERWYATLYEEITAELKKNK